VLSIYGILDYVERVGLSDSELASLRNELTAAAALPPEAMLTAVRIALAKYPQTRAMVGRLARDPRTGTTRGEWLSRSDWVELDTTQTEADVLAARFLDWQIPASELTEAAQVAVVKESLLSGHDQWEIMRLLDLSPSEYERIRQRVEQNE
jgi:hypothetical protein